MNFLISVLASGCAIIFSKPHSPYTEKHISQLWCLNVQGQRLDLQIHCVCLSEYISYIPLTSLNLVSGLFIYLFWYKFIRLSPLSMNLFLLSHPLLHFSSLYLSGLLAQTWTVTLLLQKKFPYVSSKFLCNHLRLIWF